MRSLRWRLLAGATIAIFVALGVAWLLMLFLFERHLERRIASEMENDAVRIVAGLVVPPAGAFSIDDPPADARFQRPASGLYWQVAYRGRLIRSPSLWDQSLPMPATASSRAWDTRFGPGPFQSRLLFIERHIRPAGPTGPGDPVLVQVARNAAEIDLAGREFGRELGVFLVLLWLVLSAAAWLQVALGLRPLQRLREQVSTLERNSSARLDTAGATEVQPLLRAINALADARERDLSRARRRATDLAHGLKTPLAAIAAQARKVRENGDSGPAQGLDQAVDAMRAVVEAELARARIASVKGRGRATSLARPAAERVITVLERTEAGEAMAFELDIPEALTVPVATDDLIELLGAIGDNAVRFARRRVRFAAASTGDSACLTIEDDGPGIDREMADQALIRGARLDESGGGQGLGLAIARELMEATGGAVELKTSPLGGLRVILCWPLRPAGPADPPA